MNKHTAQFLITRSLGHIVLEIEEEARITVLQSVLINNVNRIFESDFLFGHIEFE